MSRRGNLVTAAALCFLTTGGVLSAYVRSTVTQYRNAGLCGPLPGFAGVLQSIGFIDPPNCVSTPSGACLSPGAHCVVNGISGVCATIVGGAGPSCACVPPPHQLRIDNVDPPAGRASGGQQLTLTGDFASLVSVTMGGISASWIYTNGASDPSTITVSAPLHAVGAVDIDLTQTAGSPYSKAHAFAYLPTVFSDNTLTVGVTTAQVQHILEIRGAVDALRAVAGLEPAVWTDAALSPGHTIIKAIHIAELRSKLEEVAMLLDYGAASYTDPTLTSSVSISRIHIEELRQRIRAIAG